MSYIDTTQQSLFGSGKSVPVSPKFQDTRSAAHKKVNAKSLRIAIVKSLYEAEMTADEWALANNVTILNARPRFSELNKAGMLWHHGYGLTADGNKQNRYTIYPYIKTRMQLLACKYGLDKAVTEILSQFNV
jgi:hypothetical protein